MSMSREVMDAADNADAAAKIAKITHEDVSKLEKKLDERLNAIDARIANLEAYLSQFSANIIGHISTKVPLS